MDQADIILERYLDNYITENGLDMLLNETGILYESKDIVFNNIPSDSYLHATTSIPCNFCDKKEIMIMIDQECLDNEGHPDTKALKLINFFDKNSKKVEKECYTQLRKYIETTDSHEAKRLLGVDKIPNDISSIVKPEYIVIDNKYNLIFAFEMSWDEHGLAVVYKNGKFTAKSQDEVW